MTTDNIVDLRIPIDEALPLKSIMVVKSFVFFRVSSWNVNVLENQDRSTKSHGTTQETDHEQLTTNNWTTPADHCLRTCYHSLK